GSLLGQGAPGRPRGQGGDRPAGGRAAPVARERGVPRGLRHGTGPPAHPRRRRLAEHAAPPDGSERYLRDEGGDERHPQPLGAGRLVARGLRARRHRLGHRRRQLPGGSGPARPARALRHARGRGPARLRGSRALDRHDAGIDPDGGGALQLGPDGEGVLRSPLRAYRGGVASTLSVTERVAPKVGISTECFPAPPATTIMRSVHSRASGASVSGGRSLNPAGWITAKRSRFDGSKRESGTWARSQSARLKSALLQPPPATVAACSGPSTTSGSPPR